MVELIGPDWCGDSFKLVPLPTANILCVKHNNALSTVDGEARRFKNELILDTTRRKTSSASGNRVYINLDGGLFKRWLCKTYCNIMVSNGKEPDAAIIQAALARTAGAMVRCYLKACVGQRFERDPKHLRFMEWHSKQGDVIAGVFFYGFWWYVANCDLKGSDCSFAGSREIRVDPFHLLEQPERVNFDFPPYPSTLVISWPRARKRNRAPRRNRSRQSHAKR